MRLGWCAPWFVSPQTKHRTNQICALVGVLTNQTLETISFKLPYGILQKETHRPTTARLL